MVIFYYPNKKECIINMYLDDPYDFAKVVFKYLLNKLNGINKHMFVVNFSFETDDKKIYYYKGSQKWYFNELVYEIVIMNMKVPKKKKLSMSINSKIFQKFSNHTNNVANN